VSSSSTTFSADLQNEVADATIIIPTVAADKEALENQVTITLTNIPAITTDAVANPMNITIKQDDKAGLAPKNIKIVTSPKSGVTSGVNLDIQLPNSTVTLAPSAATTFPTVKSETSNNTLIVDAKASITSLEIVSGNVFLKQDGAIAGGKKADSNSNKTYLFYASDATTPTAANFTGIIVKPEAIYNLLTGAAAATKTPLTLPEDFTVEDPIVFKGTTYLNLDSHTLTIGKGGSITVKGASGKLYIVDRKTSNVVDDQQNPILGTVTSAQNEPTLIVDGGTLEIGETATGVTVSNTGNAAAISATDGTVTLTNGTVSGAISLAKGATASSLAATLTKGVINGDVTVSDGATLTESGTAAADVTINGNVAISKSTATLANAAVVGKATVTGASSSLTLSGSGAASIQPTSGVPVTVSNGATFTIGASATGTVASADASAAIADAAGDAAATIAIGAGTITSAQGAAIEIKNGANATVTAGTITGSTYAVDINKGSLTVSGAAALTGDTTINALPTAKDGVTITLSGASATYTAVDKYAVYNHDSNSDAKRANISISNGKFTGDIISDYKENFISGGSFINCNNLVKNATTYVANGYSLSTKLTDGFLTVSAVE
jgi:hypothetical protein